VQPCQPILSPITADGRGRSRTARSTKPECREHRFEGRRFKRQCFWRGVGSIRDSP